MGAIGGGADEVALIGVACVGTEIVVLVVLKISDELDKGTTGEVVGFTVDDCLLEEITPGVTAADATVEDALKAMDFKIRTTFLTGKTVTYCRSIWSRTTAL